jgi:hypothetical protein
LTYSINGSVYQSSPIFAGLVANSYNVTIKTGTCVSVSTVAVINAQPATPVMATVSITQSTCTLATGKITITAPIGSGLTYSINGSVYQTSPIFSGLTASSYNVTVKKGTCVSPVKIAVITPIVIPATPTISIIQPTCSLATGTITVTAPLGTGLTYSINGINFQSSPIFRCLTARSYSVTVKNGSCISIVKVGVINVQPATPVTPTVTIIRATYACSTGTITVTNPIGSGLTYSINGVNYQSSPVFAGLVSGSYNVTVKNGYCTSPIRIGIIPVRITMDTKLVVVSNETTTESVSTERNENQMDVDLKVSVFPNPSSANFELAIDTTNEETFSVKVFDQNGRIVNQLTSVPQDTVSFGDEWSSGLYFIEVIQGNQRKVVKAQKF